MGCSDKIKQTCGTKNFALYIEYQGIVSDNTTLDESECLNVQEVLEDLYSIADIIKEEINVTGVTSECETLPVEKIVKTLVQFLLERDCAQQEQINTLMEQIVTMQAQIADLQGSVCP